MLGQRPLRKQWMNVQPEDTEYPTRQQELLKVYSMPK